MSARERDLRDEGGRPPQTPAWIADIEVDAALAARLLCAQFPQIVSSESDVVPFGTGWDNAAFLVGGRAVFRFPRRRVGVALIEREIALLSRIAPALPLPIPVPRYAGAPSAEYPWPFAGYDLIQGRTACAVMLGDAHRAALADPLGRFLRALHGINPVLLVERGLPGDDIGRLDHERCMAAARERAAFLSSGGMAGAVDAAAWLEAHPPQALTAEGRRCVHGDLYARHIVLGGDAMPVGVIDWGDMHLGDPALDIAVAHLMLPQAAHAAFRAAYGAIDERTWDAARYRAVYHALLEMNYGVRENDDGMRDIGLAALRLMHVA